MALSHSPSIVNLRADFARRFISGLPNPVGSMVARGALIAHIENSRVNDEHIVDLREHQARVEAELKASEVNRATRHWQVNKRSAGIDMSGHPIIAVGA